MLQELEKVAVLDYEFIKCWLHEILMNRFKPGPGITHSDKQNCIKATYAQKNLNLEG
jgi:hypothetical protein